MKLKIYPNDILMISHASAEVKFDNATDANSCLDTITQFEKSIDLSATTDRRSLSCRGVITDWDETINELWEAIDEKEVIMKIEKMYRKIWDKNEKAAKEEDTGNIIVTFSGSQVRNKVGLWGGRFSIKVRPFITTVRQCFNCFKFGHIKAVCRSEEICIVCGMRAHGPCDREPKCRNCDKNHRSTFRKCIEYEYNRKVHVVMAYNNVSYGNAVRIFRGKETEPTQTYNRYEDPGKWPKLPLIGKKNIYTHSGPDKGEGREYKTTASVTNKGPRKNEEEPLVKKTSTQESRARETDSRHANERNRSYRYKQQENDASIRNIDAIRNRDKEVDSTSQYWKQFNTRSHEITKDRYGVALEKSRFQTPPKDAEAEAWQGELEDEREEGELPERTRFTYKATGPPLAQESLIELTTSLLQCMEEDQELRYTVFALLEGRKRKTTGSGERYSSPSQDEELAETDRKKDAQTGTSLLRNLRG